MEKDPFEKLLFYLTGYHDPNSPENYALFIYETFYPLNDEVAVYPTASEAEHAYREAFGLSDMGAYYG